VIRSHLGNIQLKLDESAGAALSVEVRMRLIAELNQQVRSKIAELVEEEHKKRLKKNANAQKKDENYWECNLCFLNEAICIVFQDQLSDENVKKLKRYAPFRNKIMHGDFVGLMDKLGLILPGRKILSIAGDREALKKAEIKESIVSIANGHSGISKVCSEIREVQGILDALIDLIEKAPEVKKFSVAS